MVIQLNNATLDKGVWYESTKHIPPTKLRVLCYHPAKLRYWIDWVENDSWASPFPPFDFRWCLLPEFPTSC